MNCLSGMELAVMQGTALVAFAKAGLVRGHELLTGRDPMERRIGAHRANAEFLASMGLDPDAVLGPPPVAAPAKQRHAVRVPTIDPLAAVAITGG
jgi:hypothetical protein